MSSIRLDFSGIPWRVDGLPRALARRLTTDWASFVTTASEQRPLLEVEVVMRRGRASGAPFRPKGMKAALEPDRAHFELPQGDADVAADGTARLRLRPEEEATAYFALMNLMRACLAWCLPTCGAALLHAAGLAVGGRAFLLVGPAGCGKTTWARLGEQRGGWVLSDDLVLVRCAAGQVDALGSPFRSTHRADYRRGRWPLAAILFPRHGKRAAWEPCDPLRARARIAANLPFVATAIEHDSRVREVIEKLATEIPCRELTFAPDPSFVDLLLSGEALHE